MWLKMAPCLPKFGLTRPREASRWLQIDPGGSKMVALQFRPMLFTESFLPSVTSDLQCCCSSTPRKGTTASPVVSVKGSRIGPIAFVLGSGWVRMSLKIISSWPQEAPEQSVAKAPLDHTLSHGPTWPIWPLISLCTSNSILISIVLFISLPHLDNIRAFECAFAFCFCFFASR